MSHRRVNKRTGAIAGAGAAVVVAAAIVLPYANASTNKPDVPRTFASQESAAHVGVTLAADLGDDAAGWYIDAKANRLVMNVLSEEAAERAEAEGVVARVVENGLPELKGAVRQLTERASLPGTAWSVDPKTNKVSVIVDRTVTGDEMSQLKRVTDGMPGLVTVKRSAGEFKKFGAEENQNGGAGGQRAASGGAGGQRAANGGNGGDAAGQDDGTIDGGDAIFGGQARCSLGFNVQVGGAPAFLTAGHCAEASQNWAADQAGAQQLGTVQQARFPENDFSLVKYDDPNTQASSSVDLKDGNTQEITQAAEAAVGMQVQRSGSTTGLKGGTVTGLNATVNFGNGDVVNGMIQTNVCAEPGDSGGPLFAGNLALGLTSGGSGDCTQGGETFFEPVTRALQETGAQIGNGDAGAGDAGDAAGAGDAGDAGEQAALNHG